METVTPACPLCVSGDVRVFTHKNGCTIYACNTCRYRFVYPLPETKAVYGEGYFNGASDGFGYVDYDQDKLPMISTFQAYLGLIRKYTPQARRFLDVGAATGFFVELAADAGFDAEGIELSPFAVEVGKHKGRSVRQGTMQDLETEQYDAIAMVDVLEHVPDSESDVQSARTHLNEGGVLLVNTPDTGSLYARVMGKRWHLLTPPEHVAYFDRQNLKKLLERNGFKVVHSGTLGKQFTLPYIFSTLYAWQGLQVWAWLANRCRTGSLARVKIPINLRDNMLVIAQAV